MSNEYNWVKVYPSSGNMSKHLADMPLLSPLPQRQASPSVPALRVKSGRSLSFSRPLKMSVLSTCRRRHQKKPSSLTALPPERVREQPLASQFTRHDLNDVPVVIGLCEVAPLGRQAKSGDTTGDSTGTHIFLLGVSSLMNAMSRMPPTPLGHRSGNSSPRRAISFAHAIRDVSWERGFPPES